MKKFVFLKLPDGREIVAQDLRNSNNTGCGCGSLFYMIMFGLIVWGVWGMFTGTDDELNTEENEAIAWSSCKNSIIEQSKITNPVFNKNNDNNAYGSRSDEINVSDDYSVKYLGQGEYRFKSKFYELRSDKKRLNDYIQYPDLSIKCFSKAKQGTDTAKIMDFTVQVHEKDKEAIEKLIEDLEFSIQYSEEGIKTSSNEGSRKGYADEKILAQAELKKAKTYREFIYMELKKQEK